MSRVVLVINDPNSSIEQLNAELDMASPEKSRTINALIDYLTGCVVGNNPAGEIEVTTRDSDVAVSTSGTGSTQITVSVG